MKPPLLSIVDRAPTFGILCSDRGTPYGEDGYTGHRIAHPSVWTVPYAEIMLKPNSVDRRYVLPHRLAPTLNGGAGRV
jgi:hypothetical protein